MTRVDFLRDLGLDVETAVILDDELSRLPARTQRVFEMRAAGYTNEEIGGAIGAHERTVRRLVHAESVHITGVLCRFSSKSVPYIGKGA